MQKKWLIIIPAGLLGVLLLVYLWKRRGSSSSVSTDSSSLPGVLVTGGGGLVGPSTYGTPPIQTYDSGNYATASPSAAASGVPMNSAQAQEFTNLAPSVPIAHPDSNTPSFYSNPNVTGPTLQDLPYQTVDQTMVQNTTPGFGGASPNPTLQGFLQGDVRQYEIGSALNIGNQLPGMSAEQVQSNLTGESQNYCNLHPEACAGVNQSQLISSLTNAYTDFTNAAQQVPTGAPQPNVAIPQANTPATMTPVGPAKMTIDPVTGQAVWK